MKLKWLLVVFPLLFTIEGFGQLDSISIPVYKSGDTTLHYKRQRERIASMEMIDPLTSPYGLVLRISCENWAVEVQSINLKTISGHKYFFTKKAGAQDGKRDEKLLFKEKRISRSDAMAIYRAFEKYSIETIPDEMDIRSWPLGADGMSYIIEHKTFSAYTFKTYWQPSLSRHQLKEAATLDDFIKEVEAKLELGTSYYAFLNKLPPGTYHTGGITTYTTSRKKRKTGK